MEIIRIFALCLIVCCAQISAQTDNCDSLYTSCQNCAASVPQRNINGPNECPRVVENRWVWRNVTQCEVQRVYCRNPQQRMTCDAIAELSGMRRRATPRCTTRCTTRRRTTRRRSTRRTTRSTRRTSHRLPTPRRTTRRTTRKPRRPTQRG